MECSLRPIRPTDMAFLREMLYLAIYVSEETPPPPREILSKPQIAKYIRGWGRIGDNGWIAEKEEDATPVGAAWFRLFSESDPGYGHVREDVPELTIALLPGWRGKNLGGRLLTSLIETASTEGFPGLSLSVDPRSPALRLYQRFGFKKTGESGTSWTLFLPV